MNRNLYIFLLVSLLVSAMVVFPLRAKADSSADILADQHAPITVMGDHTQEKGEWMISYRFAGNAGWNRSFIKRRGFDCFPR